MNFSPEFLMRIEFIPLYATADRVTQSFFLQLSTKIYLFDDLFYFLCVLYSIHSLTKKEHEI